MLLNNLWLWGQWKRLRSWSHKILFYVTIWHSKDVRIYTILEKKERNLVSGLITSLLVGIHIYNWWWRWGLSTWKVSYIPSQVFWGIRTIQNKFKYKGEMTNELASRGISVYWGDRRAVSRVTGNYIAENTTSSWSIPVLGLHGTAGMWGESRDASIVLATTQDRKDQEARWQRKKKNMPAMTHPKVRSTMANRQSLSLCLTSRSTVEGIM